MKTNITLKTDSALLREARTLAAQGTSISALLAGQLQQVVQGRTRYDQARRRALAVCERDSICNGRALGRGMSSMSDRFFVNTNILVYAHDRSTGAKHDRAQLLL